MRNGEVIKEELIVKCAWLESQIAFVPLSALDWWRGVSLRVTDINNVLKLSAVEWCQITLPCPVFLCINRNVEKPVWRFWSAPVPRGSLLIIGHQPRLPSLVDTTVCAPVVTTAERLNLSMQVLNCMFACACVCQGEKRRWLERRNRSLSRNQRTEEKVCRSKINTVCTLRWIISVCFLLKDKFWTHETNVARTHIRERQWKKKKLFTNFYCWQ